MIDQSDAADFAGFVRAHTPDLLRSAYLLTGARVSAEDLVQDTLLRLYPKWSRVRAADLPIAYVRRSLANNFINGRRGHNSAANREFLVADAPEQPASVDFAGHLADADLVRELLASLPPRARAVLVLRFLHDLPDEQIATDLDIRPGTVRSIVSRSLASLRAELARRDRPALSPHPKGRAS
jgi:RNA polymerase sigma-70 factor (sigma-E family)